LLGLRVNDGMKVLNLSLLICLGSIMAHAQTSTKKPMKEFEVATLGSGCFWCTEAFFLRVKGIESVVSGYSGGKVKNPTYREVCSGLTGHAEVIQVKFDPALISYSEVLEIFLLKKLDHTKKDIHSTVIGPGYCCRLKSTEL